MALRETSLRPPPPWLIRWEIFAVFAVSLGASALNAVLSLIGSLLQSKPLAGQQALLVTDYVTPPIELYNTIANLDVNSDFSQAVLVVPGDTGPFSGPLPRSHSCGRSRHRAECRSAPTPCGRAPVCAAPVPRQS